MAQSDVEEAANILVAIWSGKVSASMSSIEYYAEVIEEAKVRAREIMKERESA